jgi:hypothetical protein
MEYTVSARIHYRGILNAAGCSNSYDKDSNNTPLLAVVAMSGVDGYSGYLDY